MCNKYLPCILLLLSTRISSQTETSILHSIPYTSSTVSENPYDPNWDWNNGDILKDGVPHYWIYYQSKPSPDEEFAVLAPWYQSEPWSGLVDRKKEDGWVLLSRDFGTPTRRLQSTATPYFVLYNKYRSILRIFILINELDGLFDHTTLQICQVSSRDLLTGVLANLSPVSAAIDKIQLVQKNSSSAVVYSYANDGRWIYGDFPLSFDPTITPKEITDTPPSLNIKVLGSEVYNILLETKGFSAQGDRSFINEYMNRGKLDGSGFSLNAGSMPSLNADFNLPSVDIKSTAPNWAGLKSFAGDLKFDMGFGKVDVFNPLKGLIGGFEATLSGLSMASPLGITGLNLGSVFKFFVGGGMKSQNANQTAPTFISSHYSSKGTMTSKKQYASVTIAIPGSRINYNSKMEGNPVGLVRNDPVGVLTLKNTPRIYKRLIQKNFNGVNSWPDVEYFNEFEVVDSVEYILNEYSNLELIALETFLISEYTARSENHNWLLPKIGSGNQNFLMQTESPINANQIITRSMPVPYKHFKGRKIYQTNSMYPYVKMKIKATLKRKDDPTAQPIVFISMYEVDVVDQGIFPPGTYTITPLPTIPPQNVKCIVPSTGGVRISWDRNLENNIAAYFVERSINGGTYSLIGTTKDTLVVDNEVQKSVKPYLSNRQNVSVNYRVRAKSEWIDDDSTKKSQYSDYSDVIPISGSIIASFNKFGLGQIVPESSSLSQNFPNPFNPATTIYYGVKENAVVSIKVFNALGQEVATLVNERKEVGYHYAEWNAAGMPSGMYFYRITVGEFTETKKMTLMK